MIFNLIVAVANSGVIGNKGAIPFKQKADLARFRSLTMGAYLLMGRKTYESLPKPMDGRKIVVLTSQAIDGVICIKDISEIQETVPIGSRVFICGGEQVYEAAMKELPIKELFITHVLADVEGDTYFYPSFDFLLNYRAAQTQDINPADADNEYPYLYEVLKRI
jgi:dihydrofolate reductase